MTHFFMAKRQKLSEKPFTGLLSNVNSIKRNFVLEVNGNSQNNLNANTPSWIYYDLSKTNNQIDLFGSWRVGMKTCVISNTLSSWQKRTENKTELPSLSFVKLAVKFTGKDSKIIDIKYFQNRIYAKDTVVSQINTFLSQMWLNLCRTNTQGVNIVGNVFSLTLFSFYLDKITNSVHIVSIADTRVETTNKTWQNFIKIYNVFKKNTHSQEVIENIEIYISNDLNEFLGGFQIPREIHDKPTVKDLTKYDKNSAPLDLRCGFLPCKFGRETKLASINIPNKFKTPHISPSLINIYTNLPIAHPTHKKLYEGKTYQFLDQIPLKTFDRDSPNAVQHFPKKINYKSLTQNVKMEAVEILLINAENNELINLDQNFILNLDFQCIVE